MDHNDRDVNSHLSKHYMEKEHEELQNQFFFYYYHWFRNNLNNKKKISEALWIKDLRLTFIRQEKSIKINYLTKICLKRALQWSSVLYRNQTIILQCK